MTEDQKKKVAQMLWRFEQETEVDMKAGVESALRVLATSEEQREIGELLWKKKRASMKDVKVR